MEPGQNVCYGSQCPGRPCRCPGRWAAVGLTTPVLLPRVLVDYITFHQFQAFWSFLSRIIGSVGQTDGQTDNVQTEMLLLQGGCIQVREQQPYPK